MSVDPRDVRQFGHEVYDDDDDDDLPPIRYFMFNGKRYNITKFMSSYSMKFNDVNGVEQTATYKGRTDENGNPMLRVNINGEEKDVVIKKEEQKKTKNTTNTRTSSRWSQKKRQKIT